MESSQGNIDNDEKDEIKKIEIKGDPKKYKAELTGLSDQLDILDFRVPFREKQQRKAKSTRIRGYLATIIKNGYDSVEKIQAYLSKTSGNNKSIQVDVDARIIQTILNSRPQGKKVLFNSNLFKRPILGYIFASNVSTKCLSNDYLYLNAVRHQVAEEAGSFENAILNSVKVVSDNFKIDEDARKGLIQDYDPKFSIICTKKITAEDIKKVIEENVGLGEFDYNGYKFNYYGDEDLSIIKLADTAIDEVIEKFNNMVYLKTEGTKISEGEKTLAYNDDIHYFDVLLTPEDFCPCFWTTTTKSIPVSFLFEYALDYTNLFDYIIKTQSEGHFKLPVDFCYWTTINQVFDFMSVVALTALELPIETRELVAKYCDHYYELKPYIRKWKEMQLLLERIYREFCSYFLNTSELLRFFKLLDKIKKYIDTVEVLKKQTSLFSAMKDFFDEIQFARMIKLQLNTDHSAILLKMRTIINIMINGTQSPAIIRDIKSLILRIHSFLPSSAETNPYQFPFIIADGGLNGSALNVQRDYISHGINKYHDDIVKKKEKVKKNEQSFSIDYAAQLKNEYEFMKLYLKKRMGNIVGPEYDYNVPVRYAIGFKSDKQNLIDDIKDATDAYNSLKNPEKYTIGKRNRVEFLDKIAVDALKDYNENVVIPEELKYAETGDLSGSSFSFGKRSNKNIISNESEEEDDEEEEESKKEKIIITDSKGSKTYNRSTSSAMPTISTKLIKSKGSSNLTKKKRKRGAGYKRGLKDLGLGGGNV